MSDSETVMFLAIAAWLVAGIVTGGVIREVTGSWRDAFAGFAWPAFAIVGALWALAWLGRGPARLAIRHERRRRQASRIARAEIVR